MHPLHDSAHASAGTMKSENDVQGFRSRHFQARTFLIYLLIFAFVITPITSAQAKSATTVVGAGHGQEQIHPLVQQADASNNYIVINGDGFAPAQITIEVGESVTWHNATGVAQSLYQGAPPEELPETPSTADIFLPLIKKSSGQTSQQFSPAVAAPIQDHAPIATLAAGADFSLRFEQVGAIDFYLGPTPSQAGQIIVQERSPTTLSSVSPASGAGDVAVTRETVLVFSHPLDASSITADSVFAQFGGEKLAATRHLSPDGAKLTLFYDAPLPASARVRVTVDGDRLRDANGQAVDADGDGVAGGTAAIDFDTLGIRMIPGTSVCGHVFASELGTDASGGAQDVPLAGAAITVDGMEATLRTTTDASGDFCLDPAPASRFFVHIDGRTASTNVPAGAYYPFVGKAWEARAGAQTDIGNVYLPLVQPGTLQPVSPSEETMIHMAPGVLAERPEFADVAIKVPPDSLFANDGARGGQVGIAPVPPDRLPGTLPPFLNFPLVITVQTDGATNFDTPAPVCFPNLPAPDSGELLPAGAKSALMSFNHDAGRWEVIGPMTVSDDGALVCTDPGVGILAPGWHGALEGAGGSGGPPEPPTPPVCTDINSAFLQSPNVTVPEGMCVNPGACISAMASCWDAVLQKVQSCHKTHVTCDAKLNHGNDGGHKENSRHYSNKAADFRGYAKCKPYWPRYTEDEQKKIGQCITGSALSYNSTEDWWKGTFTSGGCSFTLLVEDPTGPNSHMHIEQTDGPATGTKTNPLPCGPNVCPSASVSQTVIDDEPQPPYNVLITANGNVVQRYRQVTRFDTFLPPNSIGKVFLHEPKTAKIWVSPFYSPEAGANTVLTPQSSAEWYRQFWDFVYETDDETSEWYNTPQGLAIPEWDADPSEDSDGDHLGAITESIIGTDPNRADTDGDGIPDGAEVEQGTNPLDGLLVEPGIVATADTPGTALDVCVNDELIVVADGEAGLALFDAPSGQNPTLLAQVDTPGNAQRVICPNANDGGSENLMAVADGDAGLTIVDVADPPAARILHQVDAGRPAGVDMVTALVRRGDVLYVGTDNAQIAAVDLLGGHILLRGVAAGAVRDLAIQGDHLFVLTAKTLDVLALPTLQRLSSTASPGTSTGRRLAIGDGVAYVVRGTGYNTFDLANP
ncbi:MAG: Ig-like domain-containing protein, partial [Caldilineaceae bacterium]|nr:Ig-like domain-containing protein [Caldilineaceae bacterium]